MNKDVLIIGGGIAGMQSALLLAEKGHHVYLLDHAPALGGFLPLLDRTFPTNSCGVCFMSPKPPAYCPVFESDFHKNIEVLTNCDVREMTGEAGNFEVSYTERPRHVDANKCTLCGKCTEVCPVEVGDELSQGLAKRKAAYIPFPQSIPRCYVIDEQNCTKCGECVKACPADAIDLDTIPQDKKIKIGAVVLAFGFEGFHAERKGEFGLGRYKNVLSSIQYERMLSHSSPSRGVPTRPSDGRTPKKIAFIQCVGSRDMSCGAGYCSSVCCMYAAKQAMVSKDHAKELDAAVFYMDMRAVGKDYERYYTRAKEEYGVRYLRSAVSTLRERKQTNNLLIAYGLENGESLEEEFDLVVLSVGFAPHDSVKAVAVKLGVSLNEFGFCETDEFVPTKTTVPGIFVAGSFREPRDIPETTIEACSAAADVTALLGAVAQEPDSSSSVADEKMLIDYVPRIGVLLCDDKGKLARQLDVDGIIAAVKQERNVSCVTKIDVTSITHGLAEIRAQVEAGNLNRVVIAGYRAIELERAVSGADIFGKCTGLFEYANVGELCANVHGDNTAPATGKAAHLIRAAVRKIRLAVPAKRDARQVQQRVLVVGGGIAGISCALALANQGIDVSLVEKSDQLGGHARLSHYTVKGSDIQALVQKLLSEVENHARIDIQKNAEVVAHEGTWGNFRSVVSVAGEEQEILHGALVLATGAKEAVTDEYLFGKNANVVTQQAFEGMLAGNDPKATKAQTVVMIQCVGSRDEKHPYCSRICCEHALKNSLKLKSLNPDANIYVLYRDMRAYGFFEARYQEARAAGVIFVRYDPTDKPAVSSNNGALDISFADSIISDRLTIKADLLVLSTGIEPNQIDRLAGMVGMNLNEDGFFASANPKGAPLDAKSRGKYFCGLCHTPSHIEDSIIQGKAAAARASALLWGGVEKYSEHRSRVNEIICSGCGTCVSVCPYDAISLDPERKVAVVDEALCKGCGTCAGACRASAIDLNGFGNEQLLAVLGAL